MPISEKFDVLFSTVGSNRITTFVTACETLKPGGKLVLVGTKGSLGHDSDNPISVRLRKTLQAHDISVEVLQCEVKEDDVVSVIQAVSSIGQEMLRKLGQLSLGFDYTGGTKSMSAGIIMGARRLKNLDRDAIVAARAVFLSSRLSGLTVLDLSQARTESYATNVQLSAADLSSLYGVATLNEGDPDIDKRLDRWMETVWKPTPEEERPRVRSVVNDVATRLAGSTWQKFIATVSASKNVPSGLCDRLTHLAEQSGGLPAKIPSSFLTKHWLEQHALRALVNTGMCNPGGARANVTFAPPGAVEGQEFELDVVGMVGHRLIVLSCSGTTLQKVDERKKTLKLKLFEAIHRAQQIGGSEALVGLVCLGVPDPSSPQDGSDAANLLREISTDMGQSKLINVFDNSHIVDLSMHFKRWIEDATRPQT